MAGRRPPRGAGEGLLRPTPPPKDVLALDDMIAALVELDANGLCLQWRNHLGGTPHPFAALAAHEDPGLSHPGHTVRRARQRDAAHPAPTEGSEARIIGVASF